MPRRLVDLSHPLNSDTPPFPGDGAVTIDVLDATEQSDREPREHLNCSRISTSLHCGTHMDAPYHFFGDGATIESTALERCVGPAIVIPIDAPPRYEITVADLSVHADAIAVHGRVLLSTRWDERWKQDDYFSDHPVISGEAAEFLVENGCHLIGVDFPSVDREPYPAHLEFLGNDVLIVENLRDLESLRDRRFRLIAVPLAITARDASPVRAVAELED